MPALADNLGMYDQQFLAQTQDIAAEAEKELRDLEKRERIVGSQQLFIELYERQRQELVEIEEAERAAFNDAWPEESKAWRKVENLPTHNINMFLPQVQNLLGSERQNRRELRFLPVERDDEKHIELYNHILSHIAKSNQDWYYEQEWFKQGLIAKRSHQELFIDYSDDPYGELKCVNRPASEVLRDVDASDLMALAGDVSVRIHMEWVTSRELERRYKNIDWSLLHYQRPDEKYNRRDTLIGGVDDRYDFPSDRYPYLFWEPKKNWVRLIRIWQRDKKTVSRLLDLNPNADPDRVFVDDFDSDKEAEKARLKLALSGYETSYMIVQHVPVHYWSYHVISGRAELDWQPDVGRFCPWVDFYAINLNGRIAGLWDVIKDRQMWINFVASKATERVGRSGTPIAIRENSTVDDLNVSIAIRDGQPIEIRSEVWDRLNGQPPFYEVPDRSLQYVMPFLEWVKTMKDDIRGMTNVTEFPSGGVTAASGLAILQEEMKKGTSSYGQNLMFARSQKARLRLYMLAEQYKKTPTLVKLKLDKIFGSLVSEQGREDLKKFVLSKMLTGGLDYEALMRGIRTLKYDATLSEDLSSLIEQQQILQTLQIGAMYGVQPSQETIVEVLPLPARIKQQLRQGLAERKQQIQQMLQSPEGQMQLAMEQKTKGQAKDGNNALAGMGALGLQSGLEQATAKVPGMP